MKYYIIRSSRKTLAVCIDNVGNIKIKAPLKMSQKSIEDFILLKSKWILSHQQKAINNFNSYSQLYEVNAVMYCGEIKQLKFVEIKAITLQNFYILIPLKYNYIEKKSSLINALKKMLKNEAESTIIQCIQNLSLFTNIKYNSIRISNTRSSWGSCDKQGNININWRAIMLAPKIIEYIIIHELIHTIEFNHSEKFWRNVQKFCPKYKLIRKQLKEKKFLQDLFR